MTILKGKETLLQDDIRRSIRSAIVVGCICEGFALFGLLWILLSQWTWLHLITIGVTAFCCVWGFGWFILAGESRELLNQQVSE